MLDEGKIYKYSGKGGIKLLIMKEIRLMTIIFGDSKCNNRMKQEVPFWENKFIAKGLYTPSSE